MDKCKKCDNPSIETDSKTYKFHNVFHCVICGFWTFKQINECCRDPYKIIAIDRRNHDLFFIRRQCLNCGGCNDMTKPLSAKKYGNEIRTEFSDDNFDKWKNEIKEERKNLADVKKAHDFLSSRMYKYIDYLSSYEWKAKRQLVLERDNQLCQECKERPADQVHHKVYDNLGNEPLDDLISLCNICHAKIHNTTSDKLIH